MAGAPSEKKTKVGVPSFKKKMNVNATTTKSVGKNKKSTRLSDVGSSGSGAIGGTEIERRDLCQEANKLRDLIAKEVAMLMYYQLSIP